MDDLASLRAEVANLRAENQRLKSGLSDADRSAAHLLAQAQEVSDNLIDEALRRVQRIIKAAQNRPPYANIGKILRLSHTVRDDLAKSAVLIRDAVESLDELIAAIEAPQRFVEPAPDPLTDRHWLPTARGGRR